MSNRLPLSWALPGLAIFLLGCPPKLEVQTCVSDDDCRGALRCHLATGFCYLPDAGSQDRRGVDLHRSDVPPADQQQTDLSIPDLRSPDVVDASRNDLATDRRDAGASDLADASGGDTGLDGANGDTSVADAGAEVGLDGAVPDIVIAGEAGNNDAVVFDLVLPDGTTDRVVMDTASADTWDGGAGCEADGGNVGGWLRASSISGGSGYMCAIVGGGLIKCWGNGAHGRLGVGDNRTRGDEAGEMGEALPAINLGAAAQKVATGWNHACAIDVEGNVKCWGQNQDTYDAGGYNYSCTKLGGNTEAPYATEPVAVDLNDNAAVDLALGGHHSCALLERGQVFCWGGNHMGQLGQGDVAAQASPVPVELEGELGGRFSATSLVAGANFNCALSADSEIKCWGQNTQWQLGHIWVDDPGHSGDEEGEMGANLVRVPLDITPVKVVAGGWHACALGAEGQVHCWGQDWTAGQLGRDLDVGTTVAAPGAVVNLGPARDISLGGNHTCALLASGAVKCWGYNGNGQLGQGDVVNRGKDVAGQTMDLVEEVPLGTGVVTGIGVGLQSSCAIFDDGQLKCWGANSRGQLGLGDTENRGDGCLGPSTPPETPPDAGPVDTAGRECVPAPNEMGENLPYVDLGGCVNAPDFARCYLDTTCSAGFDLDYDICIAGACQSPGTCEPDENGTVACNPPGPNFPLPDTGQDFCTTLTEGDGWTSIACDTMLGPLLGQDGHYVSPDESAPRFKLNATDPEPVAHDVVTGLDWTGCMLGRSYSVEAGCSRQEGGSVLYQWSEALEGCDDLGWGGYNDWRLPGPHEIQTLVKLDLDPPSRHEFVPDENYLVPSLWTSARTDQGGLILDSFAGTVRFQSVENPPPYHARCVRGGVPVADRGRLTTEGDTFSDSWTGLQWTKCPAGTCDDPRLLDWQGALQACEAKEVGDHDDWRLPNAFEIYSIADPRYAPWDPSSIPWRRSRGYWSSSTAAWDLSAGQFLYGTLPRTGGLDKDNGNRFAVCVRNIGP